MILKQKKLYPFVVGNYLIANNRDLNVLILQRYVDNIGYFVRRRGGGTETHLSAFFHTLDAQTSPSCTRQKYIHLHIFIYN